MYFSKIPNIYYEFTINGVPQLKILKDITTNVKIGKTGYPGDLLPAKEGLIGKLASGLKFFLLVSDLHLWRALDRAAQMVEVI